uniref:Nose resistant to fluoxetine protein 6 n=1 Tax=Culex pipiens TaxID=7175 RepID=A0A8D8CWM4_CULPI
MSKLLTVALVGLVVVLLLGRAYGGEVGENFPSSADIAEIFGKVLASQQSEVNATRCELQLQEFFEGLVSLKEYWAIQMFDAWGKIPSGILSGNFYSLGDYDQCRKAVSPPTNAGLIRGRYCQVSIPLSFLFSALGKQTGRGLPSSSKVPGLSIGSCLPDSCDASELKPLMDATLGVLLNTTNLGVTCDVPVPEVGTKEIVAIVIFSAVAALMVCSTAYDVFAAMTGRTARQAWTMFSVYSNGVKLFTIARRPAATGPLYVKSDQIDCLNGIRVLSMVWIVFCHNYMTIIMSTMSNAIGIYDWIKSYHSMLIVGGTVSVDSFFLLSGMLIAWSVLKELNTRRKLNVPLMYLHRYLRLTPAFAALLLFTCTLMKYCGSGPFWSTLVKGTEDVCDEYWWSALLYVQNYVNPKRMCLGHSWYLSVDMQLYLLSPLIVYPLWRWGRRVLIVIAGLILAAMGCVVGSFLANDLRLAFVDAGRTEHSRMAITYQPTHTRMGAWLLGVILGYVFFQTKHRRIVMSRVVVIVGWTVSLIAMLAIIFGDYPFQQPDSYMEHSIAWDAMYESMNRVVWAGCLGWIVFACINGYGGPVNTVLSLSVWQPLGRLSYSIYLLHLPLQMMLAGSLRNSVHFDDVTAIHKFWGDFGLTVTLAVLWSLAFESPIVVLEKLLFGSLRKSSPDAPLVPENQPRRDSGSASTASLPGKDPPA